ncbi:right-handed parallel beta-helix repeat-containing protein [Olivibacter sitiensis]|uniref:right-handed parallel beta-helix repeat-containing protein n=1 Tax=Olivibacter sitiensis TaxID=376470 RepID=UPI000686D81E|nr:right-handed parallel beta-helix repeat-containing protein [Olivibacter sitiensis]
MHLHYPSVLLVVFATIFSSRFTTSAKQQKTLHQDSELRTKSPSDDDTKRLQSLIDKAQPGDTVLIPRDTFYVKTLHLKNGVSIKSMGLLKQVDSLEEELYAIAYQRSSTPLFLGEDVQGIYLSFNAETKHEALVLENCKNIDIANVQAKGDSTRFRSFSGMYFARCDSITVSDSEIAYYGQERQHIKSYQPGTGIRMQTSDHISIKGNTIHHNGENGIFAHSSRDVVIDSNLIHHNGMSGIQVAFGSVGREKNYIIRHNVLKENAADAIDINNPNTEKLVQLEALIEGNTSEGNGWVKGHSTPDGSGIATLVGLQKIRVRKNKSSKSNRPAIYVRGCDNIEATNNQADNVAEIVGDLGNIKLQKNTLAGVRLLASVKAKRLELDSNDIHHLSLPSGIAVDSFIVRSNELKGNIHVDMEGQLVFKGNTVYSPSEQGAISLLKVKGATLSDNNIQSTAAHAISVSPAAMDVLMLENTIKSAQACVAADSGAHKLRLVRNSMDYTDTIKSEAPYVVSSDLKSIHFEDNTYFRDGQQVQHSYADSVSGQ